MTTPTTFTAPPARVLIAIVVTVVAIMGAVLVVFALTPVAQRGDLVNRVGTAVPMVLASIPAVLAWMKGRENASQIDVATAKVDAVAENVNGRLSTLIDAKTIPSDGTSVTVPDTHLSPAPLSNPS